MNEKCWWVECSDPFGRDRSVTVLVDENDDVVVITPPGQAAVLSAKQISALHDTLACAAGAATRRPTGEI
ncbi:hypothetical protein D5S17_19360 [Pseudonocardiaceae bacterium YIM PH 21723]|nr:hypothetical protein D5S17_19360 [Pseudonocardiaceae bacterium YIM PH 21723]